MSKPAFARDKERPARTKLLRSYLLGGLLLLSIAGLVVTIGRERPHRSGPGPGLASEPAGSLAPVRPAAGFVPVSPADAGPRQRPDPRRGPEILTAGATSSRPSPAPPPAGRQAASSGGSQLRPYTPTNDASDPAAAGPPPARDRSVMELADRWLRAYLLWQLHPTSLAARAGLRQTSTPDLYRSLIAMPPRAVPGARPALSIARLDAYRAPRGYSVIVDLRGASTDLVTELAVVVSPTGLRVSGQSL